MSEQGFTLIELLIVLVLVSLVSGLGLALSFGTHQETAFRDDLELVIDQLYLARAAAMQNKDGQAHGVRVSPKQLIAFTGADYQPNLASNTIFQLNLSPVEQSDFTIIFLPFNGTTNTLTTFTLSNGTNRSKLTVNEQGTIIY